MGRTDTAKTAKDIMTRVFIIAGFVRIATQMAWPFMGGPAVYHMGMYLFELTAIAYAIFPPRERPARLQNALLIFFALCAMWQVCKYLFLDPYGIYVSEYVNALISVAVTIAVERHVFRSNNK